jgi:hypothetical protein
MYTNMYHTHAKSVLIYQQKEQTNKMKPQDHVKKVKLTLMLLHVIRLQYE